jgi:hypothetical protein
VPTGLLIFQERPRVNLVEPHRSRWLPQQRMAVQRFAIHGLAVELRCDLPGILAEVHSLFQPFAVNSWPEGFTPVVGTIEPFDAESVEKNVSPFARRFQSANQSVELYQDSEKFWLVDERWGMAEIDLLKNQWRSWLLPRPTADATICAETAVLWPMAQLLRSKGLHLLPAVSVAKNGWGALIFSSFGIEPELSALARNGYHIIGQRWTAVREEDGRIAMLHMPGWVERHTAPRLRYQGIEPAVGRLDLHGEFLGSFQNHAFCDVALVTEPGRRPQAHLRQLGFSAAINVLRRAWPLVDLRPTHRAGQLPPRLAQGCMCAELQLSRDPQDLLRLLEGIRPDRPSSARIAQRSQVSLSPAILAMSRAGSARSMAV